MTTSAGCRAFEARLLALRDEEPIPIGNAHAETCEACLALARDLAANDAILSSLAVPVPDASLLTRLCGLERDLQQRAAVEEVLALLSPSALAVPEPPPSLTARLAAIGGRPHPTAAPVRSLPAPGRQRVGILAWLFGDWRLTVAAAYAVALVFVTVLGIDPLSVARQSATGLTAAGERALAEARTVAAAKLEGVLEGKAKKPLTETLDYRIYRTVAVGKARTAAWAEIVLHRLFGSASAHSEEPEPPAVPRRPTPREPSSVGLRS